MTAHISEVRPATLLKECFFLPVQPGYQLCELSCSGCDSISILTRCSEMSEFRRGLVMCPHRAGEMYQPGQTRLSTGIDMTVK